MKRNLGFSFSSEGLSLKSFKSMTTIGNILWIGITIASIISIIVLECINYTSFTSAITTCLICSAAICSITINDIFRNRNHIKLLKKLNTGCDDFHTHDYYYFDQLLKDSAYLKNESIGGGYQKQENSIIKTGKSIIKQKVTRIIVGLLYLKILPSILGFEVIWYILGGLIILNGLTGIIQAYFNYNTFIFKYMDELSSSLHGDDELTKTISNDTDLLMFKIYKIFIVLLALPAIIWDNNIMLIGMAICILLYDNIREFLKSIIIDRYLGEYQCGTK